MTAPLPRPARMVAEILRALPNTIVETQITDRALRGGRYIHVETSGGSTPNPELLDRPTLDVVSYAKGLATCEDLARDAQLALWQAFKAQTVVPEMGSIGYFSVILRPREMRLDGQPAEIFRFTATYDLGIRPAR